jgi:hypothetical protein
MKPNTGPDAICNDSQRNILGVIPSGEFLLMISVVAEGVPYTLIAVRNEFWQDAIGSRSFFGSAWRILGLSIGSAKRKQ